jgi:NADPH:quinone reductase-like Zn-dependent oxidoreductase
MKAIVFTKYGSPKEVLELKDMEKPSPKDNEVLVKIFASSICWADNALIKGEPFISRLSSGLFKPKNSRTGVSDIAGKVEAVGNDIKRFKPGDEVFGDVYKYGPGTYAEYISVQENVLALKPVIITYEEAAAVPQYAVVALQGLRDKGQIQPGHKVLIIGASGGIGTFAVQIAKSFGAEVTGVCSTRNLNRVRSIGADYVIDYTQEDFTLREQRYDIVLDIVANRSIPDYTRVLSSEGKYVAVAFNPRALISFTGRKKIIQLSHEARLGDLIYVKELIEAGKVKPIVDNSFRLSEIAEALMYYEKENPFGKVVITIPHDMNN